jgi:translation initiation factor 1 (eIF-1/SUI1)
MKNNKLIFQLTGDKRYELINYLKDLNIMEDNITIIS